MSIIVLGMHRSGTSLLVGLLQQFGYYLGEVSSKTSTLKPTGTKESLRVRQINNELLNFNNGSWDAPVSPIEFNSIHIKKIKLAVNDFQNHKWAIKDPRMLLTYSVWKNTLPNHRIIATMRHPLSVIQSLSTKNKLSYNKALELWQYYNTALLKLWNNNHFPILNFDLNKKAYYNNLKVVSGYLDIQLNENTYNEFFKTRNQNNTLSRENLPLETWNLYLKLKEISKMSSYEQ